MPKDALTELELQIDHLLRRCQALEQDKRRLEQREASLVAERAQLLKIQETTRTKIEAMIGRLKAMEQS